MMEYTQDEREAAKRELDIRTSVQGALRLTQESRRNGDFYALWASDLQCALTRAEAENKALREELKPKPKPFKCECMYCTRNAEALADQCAEYEMQIFCEGGWKDRAETAEAELARLRTQVEPITVRFDYASSEATYFVGGIPYSTRSEARAAWLAATPAHEMEGA